MTCSSMAKKTGIINFRSGERILPVVKSFFLFISLFPLKSSFVSDHRSSIRDENCGRYSLFLKSSSSVMALISSRLQTAEVSGSLAMA